MLFSVFSVEDMDEEKKRFKEAFLTMINLEGDYGKFDQLRESLTVY